MEPCISPIPDIPGIPGIPDVPDVVDVLDVPADSAVSACVALDPSDVLTACACAVAAGRPIIIEAAQYAAIAFHFRRVFMTCFPL
ncbi:protein of unknown function [Pararobbsia alpina]